MILDSTKLNRELVGINKWINANCIGTFNWSMGFGKTYGAILVIKSLQDRYGQNPNTIPFVLVPGDAIKQLWIREFDAHGITQYTIQTIHILRDYFKENDTPIVGGLLIVDELHRYTSESDGIILNKLHFTKRLGLTGTYPHKNEVIQKLFPVVDRIDEREAIHNNWIPNYIEYNIPVELVEQDKIKYVNLSTYIKQINDLFNNLHIRINGNTHIFRDELDVIYSCYRGKSIIPDGVHVFDKKYVESAKIREMVAAVMGWHSNLDLTTDYGQQRDKYWNPSNIKKFVEKYDVAVKARNELLNNNPVKLGAILNILNTVDLDNDRIIIFNASIEFADKVTTAINEFYKSPIAVCYHSDIKSRPLINPITGDFYRYTTGDKRGQPKQFGKTNLKKDALEGISSGRYKVIVSVNALNEGFNVEALSVAINTSGTINPVQQEQRNARVKRINPFDTNQLVRIYNLYFNDFYHEQSLVLCRDKIKLKNRQQLSQNIIKNTTISELYNNNEKNNVG